MYFVGLVSSSEDTLSDGAFGSFPEESVAMNDDSSITFPGGTVPFSRYSKHSVHVCFDRWNWEPRTLFQHSRPRLQDENFFETWRVQFNLWRRFSLCGKSGGNCPAKDRVGEVQRESGNRTFASRALQYWHPVPNIWGPWQWIRRSIWCGRRWPILPFKHILWPINIYFHLTLMLTLTEGTFGDWTETEGNFITLDLKIQSESSLFTVKIPSMVSLYRVSQKNFHPQPNKSTYLESLNLALQYSTTLRPQIAHYLND